MRSSSPFVRFWSICVLFAAVLYLAPWAVAQTLVVRSDVHHDVSPPLRDMAKTASVPARQLEEGEEVLIIPLRPGYKPADVPDPVLQAPSLRPPGAAPPAPMAPTLLTPSPSRP